MTDLMIAKRDLLKLVATSSGVANPRGTMPALACVLLDAKDGALHARATDLTLSVSSVAPCEVRRPGMVAVHARDLLERVKFMPDGPVTVTSDGGSVAIKAAGSARRFTMSGVPGAEFPDMPRPDGEPMTIAGGALSALLASTAYAIAQDDTRPNLNSLFVEWGKGRVTAVSTDGHRLAKAEADVPGMALAGTMLISLRAVGELRKLADGAGDVGLTITGRTAFFSVGATTLGARLVEAVFPQYRQVIPSSSRHNVTVARSALLEAVKAVSIASSEAKGGVVLRLTNGVLAVRSESPDRGDGCDEVPCDYAGPELTIGLSARYIGDALTACTGDDVVLGLGDELSPLTVRPAAQQGGDCLAVVMPMRI